MKKYILFDLDGTLTDSQEGILNSLQYALNFYGIKTQRSELKKYIGPPLLDTFENAFSFPPQKAAEAVVRYREYFAETGLFENKVYPGIEQVLTALYNAGRTLIVATSKPEEYSKRILQHFRLAGYFKFIAGSLMDETRSDKAEVIKYALTACGITDTASVIMIGDRSNDIIGAEKNGIESAGVLYGYGSLQELQTAGADHIVETVSELADFIFSL